MKTATLTSPNPGLLTRNYPVRTKVATPTPEATAEQLAEQRAALRVELVKSVANNLLNWQFLKGYIIEAWPVEDHLTMLEAAGAAHYMKATRGNHKAICNLLNTGYRFLISNLGQLVSNGNMPIAFKIAYKNQLQECLRLAQEYFDGATSNAMLKGEKTMQQQGNA